MHPTFAPGQRVEIRDAEWRIRRVDLTSDGGQSLVCEGLSELVRGREAAFLTRLESNIRLLTPESTELVHDDSPGYGLSLLYLDTLLRQTLPTDSRIYLGQHAAMDQLPFQFDPARQALRQTRQRILIADAVGLGKTLEAGILVSELIARGRGRRILVLTVKSMLAQFQQEFWNRFTIPLVRLDSVGLQRVRNRIPANHNPFHYYDRAIISIDTLKQDIEYRHYLEQAYWDIIIIDEAHNVAERGSRSQRARLARLLSTRSDTLIMLSATPHDGRPESFASLMNMLDPTAIVNPHDYTREDFRDKGLVIRRFKQDVRDQLAAHFPQRRIDILRVPASRAEEAALDRLMAARFHTLDGRSAGVGQLFRTTLEKALFSSPAACLATIHNRLKRLERRREAPGAAEDIATLKALAQAVAAITPAHFSKFQCLCRYLDPHNPDGFGWDPSDPADRLVIFTESLETLDFLQRHLPAALGLGTDQVAVLKGTLRDRELSETVERFNQAASPVRLLLCSDVAAEGINLHHLSHRLIHFDIPWSLMVFQQRNGRIDRYGQRRRPEIRYLLTESANPQVRGDQRVLEILIDKDEQASRNIGDPSEFMGVYDQAEEEARTAEAMERDADDISDLFADLLEDNAASAEEALAAFIPQDQTGFDASLLAERPRLYASDLDYARDALRWLRTQEADLQAEVEDDTLRLTAPPDLIQRLRYLPREIRPEHDRFLLTPDRRRIEEELKRCRDEDSPWPRLQYLWPLHPVMEWLADRLQSAFPRHAAPVLHLPDRLAAGEHIVLCQGGFPNRRGHTLIHAWLGVRFQGAEWTEILSLEAVLDRLALTPGRLHNRGLTASLDTLRALLPPAVAAVRDELRRRDHEARANEQLQSQLDALEALKAQHLRQLEREFERSGQPEAFKRRRREERLRHIERIFQDYWDWLGNTQLTEEEPYIQVAAVFTGGSPSA